MGLDSPTLDDREYAELLDEAIKQLPVASPEWTDHNAHDPGITILELLAWLTETYQYQLDRVTETHLRSYLQLLGVRPHPPTKARTTLSLDGPAGVTVDADTPLVARDEAGTDRHFETTTATTLTEASLDRLVSDHRGGRTDATVSNETDGMYFLAFGPEAERGSALYLGFTAGDGGDPFAAMTADEDSGSGDDVASAPGLTLWVDFHETDLPSPVAHGDEPVEFVPSVELTWQYCTDYERWFRADSWRDVPVVADETDRFYHGGAVTLGLLGYDRDTEPREILDVDGTYHWLRCKVTSPGYEVPPQFDTLAVNVAEVEHTSRWHDEPLQRLDSEGRSWAVAPDETTAQPGQAFAFERAPVLDATVTVGGREWDRVDDFDASGPDDSHFVLDPAAGEVRFGDGVRGAVPHAGQRVVATRYVHGGGPDGNVRRSGRWRFPDATLDDTTPLHEVGVVQRADATGGTEAESLRAALRRLKRDLDTPYRGVTAADCATVAEHTPGLRFGRATARPRRGATGATEATCERPNEVTVVVVPYSTLSRPVPSDGFLEAVRCHLERHRLLTDRVHLEPPSYVGVGVTVGMSLQPGAAVAGRTAAITTALDDFLDPLSGYDGDGWPFGRPLYRSELYEVVEAVPGIDCVHSLSVDARGTYERDRDGTLRIGATALLYPREHSVDVRTDETGCRGRP